MVCILACGPSVPGSIPSIPKKISEDKIVDVAEFNQWRCLEESQQGLEIFDRTYLASTCQWQAIAAKKFSCPKKNYRGRKSINFLAFGRHRCFSEFQFFFVNIFRIVYSISNLNAAAAAEEDD